MFFSGCVLFLGGVIGLALLYFSLVSLCERELRAAGIALGLGLACIGLYLLVGLGRFPHRDLVGYVLLILPALLMVALFSPYGGVSQSPDTPQDQIDERDIMFARGRLRPGSPEYESYYAHWPERKQVDDRIRAAPGLFAPDSKLYHPFAIPTADASFAVIDLLREAADGPESNDRIPVVPFRITQLVKGVARHYGVCDVGITELYDYHVYSHIGRGSGTYGAPIELDHRYAIAFTVEMNHAMLRRAPAAPEAMEVSKQYLSSAVIALQLALLIRSLGYSARAHVDGNYRVVCPLVARDAGLGEIGRMGILMTPRQGPRVRLGVVTTSLPLVPDRPVRDQAVIDFCRRCLKCAENCPSRSIPFDDRQSIDGAMRWQINSETCFHYWNVIGTDCGRCVTVCPYSHPDSLMHNVVRSAISRSPFARWAALWMDDLFYGRNPRALEIQDWLSNGGDLKQASG
jgi:ferredoxin